MMRCGIGRYWYMGAALALCASSLVIGTSVAAGTAGAALRPSSAQVAQCQTASTGHKALTKSDVSACASFPSITQHCPSGASVRVIR